MLHSSTCFFFFNDTATTEIYTLSLHDALPISGTRKLSGDCHPSRACQHLSGGTKPPIRGQESPRPETGPTHGSRGEPLDHGHGHQTPSTTPSPPGPELPVPSGRPQKRGGRGSRGQPPRAARAGRDRSVPPSESPGQDLEKNSAEAPPATRSEEHT